jgi:hypothetical protein
MGLWLNGYAVEITVNIAVRYFRRVKTPTPAIKKAQLEGVA